MPTLWWLAKVDWKEKQKKQLFVTGPRLKPAWAQDFTLIQSKGLLLEEEQGPFFFFWYNSGKRDEKWGRTLTTLTPTLRGKEPAQYWGCKRRTKYPSPHFSVYGVAESQTWLKWLSSNSTSPTKALPKAKDNGNLPLRAKKEQRDCSLMAQVCRACWNLRMVTSNTKTQ